VTCSPPAETAPPAHASISERLDAAFDAVAGDRLTLGVAVSGGSDSTALLIAAAGWAKRRGVRLAAATVDHGLRPEARGEAEAVASLCKMLGVSHDILVWSPPGAAVSQEDARLARHGLLARWARTAGADAILLGHTRDDRTETFLIRTRAGSSWWGLAGPLPSGPSPVWLQEGPVRLLRPLLAFGRDELRDWLRGQSQSWIDDPSNANARFERVRVRALAARLPGEARDSLIRTANRLALLRASVMAEALAVLRLAESGEDRLTLPASAFAGLGLEARRRLVEALVMAASSAPRPPRGEGVNRIAAALAAPEPEPTSSSQTGHTLGGLWVRRRRAELVFSAAPPRRDQAGAAGSIAWSRAYDVLAGPCTGALFV
jgi:tRNA(Ile)-lysidine synthase